MLDKKAFFLSYDGSLFHGFQIQGELDTVQKEIINCITEITSNDSINTYFSYSGRTDAGVSALWQTITVNIPTSTMIELKNCISRKKGIFLWGIRERLPFEFNPSKNAIYRDYVYVDIIDNFKCKDISFLQKVSREIACKIDLSFLYKDWKNPPFGSNTRRIYFIRLSLIDPFVIIHIRGESFVWNMIRRIVDFVRKSKCYEKLETNIARWVPGAAKPFNLFLTGVKYTFTPMLVSRINDIIDNTFNNTKIESSVLRILKYYLSHDPVVYSPFSLV